MRNVVDVRCDPWFNESMNNTAALINLTITLAGETREVAFHVTPTGTHAWSDAIFAARIGRGAKLNRANIVAFRFETVADARRKGYAPSSIFERDGAVWGVQMVTNIRNRQAYVTAWLDQIEGTGRGARHHAYNGIR